MLHIGKATLIADINSQTTLSINSIEAKILALSTGDSAGFWSLFNVVGEILLSVEAEFVLQLAELTNGVIPDFTFELAEASFLIVGDGGNTGLPAGIYLYGSQNTIPSLASVLNSLMSHFSGVLSGLGIPVPSFTTSTETSFGVFLNTNYIGFEIKTASLGLKCSFKIKDQRMSCQVNNKFIAFIYDSLKWAIKEAAYAWDETQETLMTVGNSITSFEADAQASISSALNKIASIQTALNASITAAASQYIAQPAAKVVAVVSSGLSAAAPVVTSVAKKIKHFWKKL